MAGVDVRGNNPDPHRLGTVIRDKRTEILARWQRRVRALPHAQRLDQPRLVDHIPELLDRIAWMTEARGHETRPELGKRVSTQHAIARLEEGFDLLEVVDEFGVLGEVLRDILSESGETFGVEEIGILDRAIHTAVRDSVERYTDVRERTLQGFDRIGVAALESRNLDDLLRRLLQVMSETTPSIEMGSIYLRDGDLLRVRAAVGLGREIEEGLSMRIGEGFAGLVAERGEPMTLHHPSAEQLRSPALASANLRVIYGVPIRADDRVIGVAKIASRTADDFSLQDMRIFGAMVARASAAILAHVLREQAEESERQLRALADNIPQLAWMADARGNLYWFNAGWYAYTGLTPEDMKGDWKSRVQHPGFDEQSWHDAIAAGRPWEDLLGLRARDGNYRWFLSRAVPIRNADGNIERWFGTNTDVTARRFLDSATKLLGSSLDYRKTLELVARLAVPDLADCCTVELIENGKREQIAVVGDTKPSTARLQARLTARGETFGTIDLVMTDSGRQYTAADVEAADELGIRAGVAVDNARLYRDAHQAVRVRDDVLAIVSHDLRNPLGAIDLAATLLLPGADARSRKHVATIQRSVERMDHLINDLLDMASINVGELAIHPTQLDAGEVFAEVLELHEPLANERGITILRESEVEGVTLNADRDRLDQMFGNLLGNAIKFCNPGDVVMARAERDGDRVRFSLSDTGPGISAAELPHIFEPYWSGRSGKKKGTGLGLFITKAIVEAHGGTISVASEEGHGATFDVTLSIA
jgi:PAS domain S-box-containing protein